MSDERAAFEAAIAADRYDQTSRLVYADWLNERGRDDEAEFQRRWTPEWQRSEDWVKAFCERVNLNYGYFIGEAAKHLDTGEDIACNLDTSNGTMDEDMAEVWRNVAIVLRHEVDEHRDTDPFTCGGDCYPDGLGWEDGNVE